MNDVQRAFLEKAADEAAKANHPFPHMAACEAALESSWGNSQLAREDCNLFGTKQHSHPIYGTVNLPTREWVNGPDGHRVDGRWVSVTSQWVKYPDWRTCFSDRLVTLERLSNAYPHYAAALRATDAETYIAEVSKTWSTDPDRAKKVLSIYQAFAFAASEPANE
jgi:flagellum-specific peptidoglycan hydrolase FlgJ